MTKYQEFLNKANIISEDLFNDIIKTLPDFNMEDAEMDNLFDYNSQNEIAAEIIATILQNWNYVTCENVDFERRTFDICDVDSREDLEEIKSTFSNWTITNYDECLEEIKEIEEDQAKDEKREGLLNYIRNHASIEDLENFANGL
jgi:hypothetical protein